MTEHIDVLIVGAGLSGVGAAAHMRRAHPGKSLAILEGRDAIGGTWDLFRYPGVRSDSDMFTLGYSFRPWSDGKSLADGEAIRRYIVDTVADEGLAPLIRLRHRVVSASWSSAESLWTVIAESPAGIVTLTCSFLSVCSGYYRYDQGFTPEIPGLDTFDGPVIHPQLWPDDLPLDGQRVVVIGSGATAVTLVPAMAAQGAHVTMLQRSPSYIAVVARRDKIADRLRGRVPDAVGYAVVRAKNIGWSMLTYQLARRRPETMKRILRSSAVDKLPAGFPVDTHLAPTYQPWDQRLCAIPGGDLYRAISRGDAEMVTDRIDRVTASGIDPQSGGHLDADVIVTATGLNLIYLGGMTLAVDGREVDPATSIAYKGMMLAGVPNFAMTIGYTNASWTLKADLVARYLTRLIGYMDRHGYASVTPHAPESVRSGELTPLIDLQSGYVLRDIDALPKQGASTPWRLHQNYLRDLALFRLGPVGDGVRFGRRGEPVEEREAPARGASRLDELALPGTAMILAGGLRMRYRVTGDGPPILLLHGIGQSLEDWSEQHELLAARHTVYSVDLPGFGWSEALPARATLSRTVDAIRLFTDALGLRAAMPVVGNSLGGAVAMGLAARYPGRVSHLVLVDSAGFGADAVEALRLITVPVAGELLMRPSWKNSTLAVRSIFADRAYATDERIRHAFERGSRPSHRRTMLQLARSLGTARGIKPGWRASLIAAVARRDRPTLIMWGDRDRILPFTHFAAATRALPDASTHVFEGAGHAPQIERAEEFAEVLEAFLARSGG